MSDTSGSINLGQLADEVREGALKGLFYASEHIVQVAGQHAPHEEGILQGSGAASQDESSLTAAMSFDTPYAARQHEEMTWKHDDGRTAKYLENAMNSERETAAELIAREIRKQLGTD